MFFSVTTPELVGVVSPKNLEEAGLSVRTDIAALSTEIVAAIRNDVPDVDAIIAITHTGFGEGVKETAKEVAAVEGIDVVVDGHDHQMRLGDTAEDVNGTPVVSTGTAMTTLLVLIERMTCYELIFKLGKKGAAEVVKALDKLYRRDKELFPRLFKTIITDNGCEFADAVGMQKKGHTVVYPQGCRHCEVHPQGSGADTAMDEQLPPQNLGVQVQRRFVQY